MPRRATNLLLGVLVAGLAGSGLASWIAPDGKAGIWYWLHGSLGIALLLILPLKLPISAHSIRRRTARRTGRRSMVPGLLAAGLVLAATGLGLGWSVASLDLASFGGYSPLNVHVLTGLLLVAVTGWHLAGRWDRKPSVASIASKRRTLLTIFGVAAGGVVGWTAVASARGPARAAVQVRATGSRHVGSFSGNAYPETIWQFDRVPDAAADRWRLSIIERGAVLAQLSRADLAGVAPANLAAVLDCTGGWWTEQRWSGYRIGDLLAGVVSPDREGLAEVVSVTGHRWSFALADLRDMLLATHVGDEPLTPGHGGPLRLVAPGRRGFQWVKWVERIDIVA